MGSKPVRPFLENLPVMTPDTTTEVLHTVESRLSPEAANEALKAAAAEEKFGVLAELDIQGTLNAKGFPFSDAVRVLEVCSPPHAHKVLSAKLEISTALPCRFGIFQRDGRTWISTIRPTVMLGMFQAPELAEVAREVEEAMFRMMEKARG